MAQIEIEWVEWHRPTKLGVDAYESLKARIGSSQLQNKSFEELRVMLNPDSLGRDRIRWQLKFEGGIFAAGVIVAIFVLDASWVEDFGHWLDTFDNLFMTVVSVILHLIYFLLCLGCFGVIVGFGIRGFTYWPSVGMYVLKNRMFVRRRLRAIQKSHSYEDYLNRE